MLQSKLIKEKDIEKYETGYFLTIEQLQKLCRDFQVDCHDGFVSNDNAYIETWINKNIKI